MTHLQCGSQHSDSRGVENIQTRCQHDAARTSPRRGGAQRETQYREVDRRVDKPMPRPYQGGVSDIVEEIRTAYGRVGIRLDRPPTSGTYYRLLCAGCGRMVGNVGDRLLPDMAAALVEQQFDLYATGGPRRPLGHPRH